MKVVGLVTEYNPFHNGHYHHVQEAKRLSGAQHVAAVMSGHFVQRGEPAIFDKWTRAAMAVQSGISLVIELPTVFSVASAEYFAFGAVDLLNQLGLVTDLVFGSESGDIAAFKDASRLLTENAEAIDTAIGQALSTGISYPSARQAALENLTDTTTEALIDLIKAPNNILGLEYLKALHLLDSGITPSTICRIGSDYNATRLQGCISSATAIRSHLYTSNGHDLQALSGLIPSEALELLNRRLSDPSAFAIGPVFPEDLEIQLLSRLRNMTAPELASIHDVREGLENRIKEQARCATSLNELLTGIKSKRYALTRIQRILIKALLGITDAYMGKTGQLRPQYVRILAFDEKGRELIAHMRKTCALPVITRPSKEHLGADAEKMLSFDLLASDLYALCASKAHLRRGGRDFSQPPIYLR